MGAEAVGGGEKFRVSAATPVINRWYGRYGQVLRRFILALMVMLGLNMVFPHYQAIFPQEWTRLVDLVLLGAFSVNLSLGYGCLVLLVTWLIVSAQAPLGLCFVALWVLAVKVTYWVVDLIFQVVGIGKDSNIPPSGVQSIAERLLILLTPFATFAHVGYFVPIYGGSRLGWRGVRAVIGAVLATSILMMCFGYQFWGVSYRDVNTPTVYTIPVQSLKGATLQYYLGHHVHGNKGSLGKYIPDWQEIDVFSQALWSVLKSRLSTSIGLFQIVLWGVCAAVVSIRRQRGMPVLSAVLTGGAVLMVGYFLIPILVSEKNQLFSPENIAEFVLSFGSALAMALIPELVPDPGPSWRNERASVETGSQDRTPRRVPALDATAGIGTGSSGGSSTSERIPKEAKPADENQRNEEDRGKKIRIEL